MICYGKKADGASDTLAHQTDIIPFFWSFYMMLVRTVLGASAIHGIGIFAAEDIPAGTQIWESNLTLDIHIPEAQVSSLPPLAAEFVDIYAYPSLHKPGHMVLESDNGRFMNHTTTPNTNFSDRNKGFAKVGIKKGEEITCDYREFIEGFQGYEAA